MIYEVECVISSKTGPQSSDKSQGVEEVKLVLVTNCPNGSEKAVFKQIVHLSDMSPNS